MKYMFYESPVGRLTILLEEDIIKGVVFGDNVTNFELNEDLLLGSKIFEEFDGYFSGKSKKFNLKLHLEGTEFQKAVWGYLHEIPYGETLSYSDLAAKIGSPKAVRAVGNACGRNPIPIIIPCHRVVGKDGSLTGFAGGIDNKKRLLELENKNKKSK